MDVMQRQVDEYEAEIRLLKDPKSPRARGLGTPKRTMSLQQDYGRRSQDYGAAEVPQATVAAMQAAFFRPALEAARKEASEWKANAVASAMMNLPHLNLPGIASLEEESKDEDPMLEAMTALNDARNRVRVEKASFTLIDLTRTDKSPRAQLIDSLTKTAVAEEKLREATAAASRLMSKRGFDTSRLANVSALPLVGKVKVERPGTAQVVPLQVNKRDIAQLQLHMIK